MAHKALARVGSGSTAGGIGVFGVCDNGTSLERLPVVGTGDGVSHVALHPTSDFACVTYSHANRLSAFVIDRAAGCLRPLNDMPAGGAMGPAGSGACDATVDAAGRFLLIASYRGHSVTTWTIEADGRIGDLIESTTAGRHAH